MDDAEKILKRTKKTCPECGEWGLYIISRDTVRNDVTHSLQYLYCDVCWYEEPYRNNHKNKDESYSDEDLGGLEDAY